MGSDPRPRPRIRLTVQGVTIRRASESDLGHVLGIEGSAFGDPWTKEAFESALTLPHFRFMVAERAPLAADVAEPDAMRTISGYIIIVSMTPEAEVANIAVHPAERGQGVGGLLLGRALEQAASEGVETVYLEVRESNSAARHLYVRHGFETVGRRRNYYDKPREDALILRRDLDDS